MLSNYKTILTTIIIVNIDNKNFILWGYDGDKSTNDPVENLGKIVPLSSPN